MQLRLLLGLLLAKNRLKTSELRLMSEPAKLRPHGLAKAKPSFDAAPAAPGVPAPDGAAGAVVASP
eukprot:CAMPEP_0202402294 /NCGR_PEP_ID=MMETSP1128-20130828/4136_1 /ASSEMBLY_ACC=CAM_ASM_000463 /TAXON_ID=3047 /ORGANISM="Dunaliella tertiolecta, Strain CCMP1320" /LENGTH=65 /DNA_ID=CAMNT_0049006307 /DNA_START=127 /DNA_END=322 /DNA_ORIENTATION=-